MTTSKAINTLNLYRYSVPYNAMAANSIMHTGSQRATYRQRLALRGYAKQYQREACIYHNNVIVSKKSTT